MEEYSAIIKTDKLKLFGGWSVLVECNDLTTFNELCSYIKGYSEKATPIERSDNKKIINGEEKYVPLSDMNCEMKFQCNIFVHSTNEEEATKLFEEELFKLPFYTEIVRSETITR